MPLVPGPGAEFANFGNRDLLLGLTSDEAWVNLTDEDLQVKNPSVTFHLFPYAATTIVITMDAYTSLQCVRRVYIYIYISRFHRILN